MSDHLTIPYGKQWIDENDIQSAIKVFQSDWLTQGPKIQEFEGALSSYCGSKYAVAVSSGTAALHLANLAIGHREGDKIITSPITFVVSSNSVIYAGGTPIFADICEDSFNINPAEMRNQIIKHPEIKGIISVYFAGLIPEVEEIYNIAKENDLWIIEDACHAFGGRWKDSKGVEHIVGDCAYSDMATFSFHPVKHITTGEGGVILTNNKELYKKLLILRNHGITKDPEMLMENHGDWYYEMQNLGFNYRMTDIQAALGLSQLEKSDQWIHRRNYLIKRYDEFLIPMDEVVPQCHPPEQKNSFHLYVAKFERRKKLYEFLRCKNIYTQVHYIPIHLQPYYRQRFGYKHGDYPIAEEYYSKALSLPLYPRLTDQEQNYVIENIIDFYGKS